MSAFTLTWPEPGIAVLTFDLPGKGANILSRGVADGLHFAESIARRISRKELKKTQKMRALK